jgi:hypothetical protein
MSDEPKTGIGAPPLLERYGDVCKKNFDLRILLDDAVDLLKRIEWHQGHYRRWCLFCRKSECEAHTAECELKKILERYTEIR